MISAAIALFVACVVTAVSTPVVRRMALRRGVVDCPGGRRIHQRVTPRLGGTAVYFGFFAALATLALADTSAIRHFTAQPGLILGLLAGGTLVATVGAVDDVRGVGPWRKLAAQAAAALLAYEFGYRIDVLMLPWVGSVSLGVFALPVTIAWFLGITNAINLIDGLDGLASGIALFACISNFAIAEMNDATTVVILSACLGGALLGFLRYNFNPASIFLGDSGSMFIGFVLAATSLAGATTKSSTAVAILAPMVALGVPIFDTMLAMIRRTISNQSIFIADRGHIHHRLLDMGLTHRRVVLMLYGMSVLLGVAALGIAFGRSWYIGGAVVVFGCVVFVLARLAGPFGRRQVPNPARLANLHLLEERVRVAVLEISVAADRNEISRCLARFNADGPHSVSARLIDDLPEDMNPEARFSAQTLVYSMSSQDRMYVLEVRMGPALEPNDVDVKALLGLVADACSDALARTPSPRVQSLLGIRERATGAG